MDEKPWYMNPTDSFMNLARPIIRYQNPNFEFYRSAFNDYYIMKCRFCRKGENLPFKDFHANDKQFNQEMIDIIFEKHKDCSKKR